MSAGTTTGARGASLDWDRPARVTPAERREVSAPRLGRALQDQTLRPSRRKHGLTLSLGDEHSLWREPRWNAERRALPLERCRAPSPSPASGRGQEETARRMDYASLGVPLPFIAGSGSENRTPLLRDDAYRERTLKNFFRIWLLKIDRGFHLFAAEHNRAEGRSHRRFRRDAMVLGGVVSRVVWHDSAPSASRERICLSAPAK